MYLRRVAVTALLILGGGILWGCSRTPNFVAKHEPWRKVEERACLDSGFVREKPWLVARASLGAPSSYCGATRPFQMSAANNGRVTLRPSALLRCNMIPAVERWMHYVALPAARRHYGSDLTEVKVAASYACRPINGQRGNKLSEHGHANAIDISNFTLADGRKIAVKTGWWGNPVDRAFLRDLHRGACREFTTVLGPNYNRAHHDHFHFDLARRTGRKKSFCK